MECNDIKEAIIDFIVGEVSPEQKDLVLQHIATCRKCRDELSELVSIEDGTKKAFKINSLKYPIPTNALEKIKQQIAKGEKIQAPKKGIRQSILRMTQNLSKIRLLPRSLSWKTGLASVLVVCIAIVLAVIIPIITGQSPEVLAANIALNSPQFQSILLEKGIDYREAAYTNIIFYENQANVIFEFGPDLLAIADVDLETKEMVQLYTLDLTDERKQEIVDIARTNPEVQDLLEQGAYIDGFYPTYDISHERIVGQDGKIQDISYIDFTVNIGIQLGGAEYVAIIDLNNNQVLDLVLLTK